ncbi:hypothetical protein H696_03420 [Fonticula alba]|uniref:Uncharacterized protein n=1 Tax=Fonticula alba TaxID=691883 RepID=A0A058Z6T8_FONAL|nr:hypothetical protein H696_03420 [Fonticula alba]KCV69955.1 hypothetical protein H696_03420 [Fonticula alba]|eukprot:XP_009495561.1 hypothetical protein H696_03420 [Fonticula alba]
MCPLATEKEIRDKGVADLHTFLGKMEPTTTDLQLLKLWKALYYSMWMADMPPVQHLLGDSIADLVPVVPAPLRERFIVAFWQTIAREWHTLDKYRLDKFLALIRKMVRASLKSLHGAGWPEAEVVAHGTTLQNVVLLNGRMPNSVRFHLLDVWADELEVVLAGEQLDTQDILRLMDPFLKAICRVDDSGVFTHLRMQVFLRLFEQARASREFLAADEQIDTTGAESTLRGQTGGADRRVTTEAGLRALLDALFMEAAAETSRVSNRRHVYDLYELLKPLCERLAEGERLPTPQLLGSRLPLPQRPASKRRKQRSASFRIGALERVSLRPVPRRRPATPAEQAALSDLLTGTLSQTLGVDLSTLSDREQKRLLRLAEHAAGEAEEAATESPAKRARVSEDGGSPAAGAADTTATSSPAAPEKKSAKAKAKTPVAAPAPQEEPASPGPRSILSSRRKALPGPSNPPTGQKIRINTSRNVVLPFNNRQPPTTVGEDAEAMGLKPASPSPAAPRGLRPLETTTATEPEATAKRTVFLGARGTISKGGALPVAAPQPASRAQRKAARHRLAK